MSHSCLAITSLETRGVQREQKNFVRERFFWVKEPATCCRRPSSVSFCNHIILIMTTSTTGSNNSKQKERGDGDTFNDSYSPLTLPSMMSNLQNNRVPAERKWKAFEPDISTAAAFYQYQQRPTSRQRRQQQQPKEAFSKSRNARREVTLKQGPFTYFGWTVQRRYWWFSNT